MSSIPLISAPTTAPTQPVPLVANSSSGSSGLSFGDILDTVNPLQHIPVLSSLYRAATGSQISSAAQVAGDTLYGALLPGGAIAGFASSLADVAVKQLTGKNVGQMVVSAVAPSSASPTMLVANPQNAGSTPPVAAPAIPAVPYVAFNQNAQASSSQYQRVQALDAINRKLLKMTA